MRHGETPAAGAGRDAAVLRDTTPGEPLGPEEPRHEIRESSDYYRIAKKAALNKRRSPPVE